jgi:myo-inositol-1(or 4)-monophosphatase
MNQAAAVLREAATAAITAYRHAMTTTTRAERERDIGLGGDGTPTMALDAMVEAPVLDVLDRHGVNVLSEEIGWVDRGSSITVVVDPVDGTANAAAGVPLSCFAAALAVDGVLVEGLALWLDTGRSWWASTQRAETPTVTGRLHLDGASISMLRPRPTTSPEWYRLAARADRTRILGTSVLEACLVADGAIDAFCDPGGDVHRIVDLAATSLIVEAAGGYVCDVHGRPLTLESDLSLRWSGIVAASRELAEAIADEVAGGVVDLARSTEVTAAPSA